MTAPTPDEAAAPCHVETFTDSSRAWGWQCFTCDRSEAGYPGLRMAETAGDRHRVDVATRNILAERDALRRDLAAAREDLEKATRLRLQLWDRLDKARAREAAARPVLDADRLARALHDADCGCGDYDEVEDPRYITAARAALSAPVEAAGANVVRIDVQVPFTARAAACNLLMNADPGKSIPELADVVLRETAPYVVAANSPQPEEAMGMVGMRGHLLGVLGRDDDPLVSTFELLEDVIGSVRPAPVEAGATEPAPAFDFMRTQDAIEDALRAAGHDIPDLADVVFVATEAVRALAGAGAPAAEPAPDGAFAEMATVIDEVIAHYHQYSELDEPWLAETARRLRALAGAGAPAEPTGDTEPAMLHKEARCPSCYQQVPIRSDGLLMGHDSYGETCPGSRRTALSTGDHVSLTRTFTRTHSLIRFANPYLTCDECEQFVTAWHNSSVCDCDAEDWLEPCEHHAEAVSACPSWGPVDGCLCELLHGTVEHDEPRAALAGGPSQPTPTDPEETDRG